MYREEYKKLGPSIFRFLHISLASYEKLAKSENPVLKSRAALVPGRVKKARVLYPVGIVFAPSPEVRTALRKDFHQIIQMFGWLSIREILLSAVAFVLYAWSSLRFRFSWNIQPKSIVKEYLCGDENPTGYPQKAAVSTEDGISQKTALRTTSTHYIGSTGSCRTDDRF
jgi:hypothetical protein